MNAPTFAQVVEQGSALQQQLPHLALIAVGGTAVALHCQHRVSLDVDAVTPLLQERYETVAATLEQWEGWSTSRKNPPVLILGLRQQRRAVPIQRTHRGGLVVATATEMLRVKAFLMAERRATRDFVDVAALTVLLGQTRAREALCYLNLVYGMTQPQSALTRFAEASATEPHDLKAAPLSAYRGLRPPFTDWGFTANVCRRLAQDLLKLELTGALPQKLDAGFFGEPTT